MTSLAPRLLAYTHGLHGLPPHDRMGVMLFGSALLHMVIVLGLGFVFPSGLREGLPRLEITLVQTHTDQAPDNPQFLAQHNQDGGGDSEIADSARSPLPLHALSERNEDIPAARPSPQQAVPGADEPTLTVMGVAAAARRLYTQTPQPEQRLARQQPETLGLPEPDRLEQERIRLNAELSRSWQEYQKMPRKKYLNARTQEFKYAAYMDAWRAKVERIGNLNYPEQAKRQGIGGSLLLTVAVNADGSLHDIKLSRSSGHKVLDDAAARIVQLAAPYAAFPPDIRADTDVIYITRTWKFSEAELTSTNE